MGLSSHTLRAIEEANKNQKKVLGKKIQAHFASQGGIAGKTIGIWGLAFKPDTDDIREAPSLELIDELLGASATLQLYDPAALDPMRKIFGNHPAITWCSDEYHAATGADALVLM